jgi:cytochrome c-type biogenesis protein CcmH
MLLAFLLAGVTLVVLAMVLGPLLKPAKAPTERAAFDRAVYRDQLSELEREVARGVIEPREAASARLELQRRVLATDIASAPNDSGKRRPILAAGLAVTIIVVAGALYWWKGTPGLPDEPYAERGAERDQAAVAQAQMAQIHSMVAKLAEEMKSRPDDLEGWLRLGRSYAVLGQPDDAAAAFAQAERLKPDDPAVLLAEAQALMAGHALTEPISDQAVALLRRVSAIDAGNPAAMWYLGLYAAQQGNFAEARENWQKLMAALPDGSEERRTVASALDAIKGR